MEIDKNLLVRQVCTKISTLEKQTILRFQVSFYAVFDETFIDFNENGDVRSSYEYTNDAFYF